MILTCPACATRYQADETKFPPDGRQVRCAKCGHVWHQPGPSAEPAAMVIPETQSDPMFDAPAQGGDSAPSDSVARTRAQMAAAGTGSAPPRRRPLLPMLAVVLGWIGLIVVVLLIGLSAVRYRQEITVIWPQSAGVYAKLGMDVNTHGIDFIHVDYHRESEDGQVVLAVSGQIINNGSRELPVPPTVLVTLSDAARHELYHWNFPAGVASLKPGQTVPFLTRLSSPPASARHLEVKFAK